VDTGDLVRQLNDRRLTDVQREGMIRRVLPDVDAPTVQRLTNPRLSDEQKEALLDAEVEKQVKKILADSPSGRFALNTAPGEFRVWQLVTYQFVHADVWHLFGNMLFLFCFGNAVNAKLGHLTFLGLYLACGVFAGLAWMVLGRGGGLVGASGAIAGINGVFLVLYPLNEVAVWDLWWVRVTGDALRVPSWLFIAFFMGMDFLGTMTRWGGGVAYVCHLAGETLGVGLAAGLVVAGVVRSGRGERNLLAILGIVSDKRRRKKRRVRAELPPPTSEP
jgi:membrane associated rhomboid family serine protease